MRAAACREVAQSKYLFTSRACTLRNVDILLRQRTRFAIFMLEILKT